MSEAVANGPSTVYGAGLGTPPASLPPVGGMPPGSTVLCSTVVTVLSGPMRRRAWFKRSLTYNVPSDAMARFHGSLKRAAVPTPSTSPEACAGLPAQVWNVG